MTLLHDDLSKSLCSRRGTRREAGPPEKSQGEDTGALEEVRVGIKFFDKRVETPEGKLKKARKENLSKMIRGKRWHKERKLLSKGNPERDRRKTGQCRRRRRTASIKVPGERLFFSIVHPNGGIQEGSPGIIGREAQGLEPFLGKRTGSV
jgi:hypothetical protein